MNCTGGIGSSFCKCCHSTHVLMFVQRQGSELEASTRMITLKCERYTNSNTVAILRPEQDLLTLLIQLKLRPRDLSKAIVTYQKRKEKGRTCMQSLVCTTATKYLCLLCLQNSQSLQAMPLPLPWLQVQEALSGALARG